MKKKAFNGQLKDPVGFVIGLCIISLSCIFVGVVLICVLLYGEPAPDDKILGICMAAVSLLVGIGYPILFIYVVKNRKKHPRLAKLMVKQGYFVDEES